MDNLLIKFGINPSDIDKKTVPEYSDLCKGVIRAELQGLDRWEKDLDGNYSDALESVLQNSPSPNQLQMGTAAPSSTPAAVRKFKPESSSPSKKISQVIEDFCTERMHQKKWKSEKAMKKANASMEMLIDYFGDVPINSLTRPMMAEYRQALPKIPSRRNSYKKYKGKSIPEILAMKPDESPLHINTARKHFKKTKELFKYAKIDGLIPNNPTEGMEIEGIDPKGEPFDKNELIQIFNSPDYMEDTHNKSFKFWTPLLGLYTGARLDELCSLRLKDFQKHEGIWCIEITQDPEDNKSLKNDTSIRAVPLHPFLVDGLGIIKRVENLKQLKKRRFFPELKVDSGGRSKFCVSNQKLI